MVRTAAAKRDHDKRQEKNFIFVRWISQLRNPPQPGPPGRGSFLIPGCRGSKRWPIFKAPLRGASSHRAIQTGFREGDLLSSKATSEKLGERTAEVPAFALTLRTSYYCPAQINSLTIFSQSSWRALAFWIGL